MFAELFDDDDEEKLDYDEELLKKGQTARCIKDLKRKLKKHEKAGKTEVTAEVRSRLTKAEAKYEQLQATCQRLRDGGARSSAETRPSPRFPPPCTP